MRYLLLTLLLLASCAASQGAEAPGGRQAGPVGAPEGPWRQQTHWIPFPQPDGGSVLLLGRVCRPVGDAAARVVVIAHGTSAVVSDRSRTQLQPCDGEAATWFLKRGYVVVFSLRRGYGGTGGGYFEASAGCSIDGYAGSARIAARDVDATVAYALTLPYTRRDGAVVVGQSTGGWTTLGINAAPHPGIAALVSMAGGRGGHFDNLPGHNCKPENLVAAAGVLGRTATTPMLWIFTQNDSFFAPAIAQAMHQAYVAAGGKADLHQLPPFGRDGHGLFFSRGGSLIWGPLIETYLVQQGAS